MAERRVRSDFVPHLPDLLASLAGCWRALRDSQSEVDPFGCSFEALEDTRVAVEALVYRLTGERRFLTLKDAAPSVPRASADAGPF